MEAVARKDLANLVLEKFFEMIKNGTVTTVPVVMLNCSGGKMVAVTKDVRDRVISESGMLLMIIKCGRGKEKRLILSPRAVASVLRKMDIKASVSDVKSGIIEGLTKTKINVVDEKDGKARRLWVAVKAPNSAFAAHEWLRRLAEAADAELAARDSRALRRVKTLTAGRYCTMSVYELDAVKAIEEGGGKDE